MRQNRSFAGRWKHDIQPCRLSLGTSVLRSDAFGRSRPRENVKEFGSTKECEANEISRRRDLPLFRTSSWFRDGFGSLRPFEPDLVSSMEPFADHPDFARSPNIHPGPCRAPELL